MTGEEPIPLYGRHPVREALRAGQRPVHEIAVLAEGRGPGLRELIALARSQGVKISYRTRDQLTAMAASPHHQGVVARLAEARYASVEAMLEAAERDARPALLLALDRVQDPRNLGAILRTAEATGVHGVIVTKHQSAGLTPAVARSAMGGLEHVPVARETNMVQALERLKQARVWVMGTAAEGGRPPWDVDLAVPLCLVLGGEGPGLRPLVARTCDVLLSLPMRGRIGSLNVSAAAAALCYEILRQRAMTERRERA